MIKKKNIPPPWMSQLICHFITMPWWNWGGKLEWSVSRAQAEGAGITDLEKKQRRTLKDLQEM